MNWGKGLALALIAFASLMAWFVVKASQSPEPLVTESYYEQELKFQGRIDEEARAAALGPVEFTLAHGTVIIRFPERAKAGTITGELQLLRPNDPMHDMSVKVEADSAGLFSAALPGLVAGRYNAMLSWKMNGVSYYTEEKLLVP